MKGSTESKMPHNLHDNLLHGHMGFEKVMRVLVE
jgi:hypothetical protein